MGHPEQEDVVLYIKVSELRCCRTLMVVKDKETFTTKCLHSSLLLKMLYKLKANLTCGPPLGLIENIQSEGRCCEGSCTFGRTPHAYSCQLSSGSLIYTHCHVIPSICLVGALLR